MKSARSTDVPSIEGASVLIAGCGSVGSFVAANLASAGVRRLILVDRDSVEKGNLHRHLAERNQIGERKVNAVARQLMLRFDGVEVQREHICLLKAAARLRDLLATASVCVVAVDREAPKYLIDRLAMHYHTPVIFVGVYGAGTGVEVVLQSPHHGTPCYGCSAAAVGRFGVEVEETGDIRSGRYDTQGPPPVDAPWSRAHLGSITAAASLGTSFTLSLLREQLGDSSIEKSLLGERGGSVWQMFLHSDSKHRAWHLNPLPVVSNPDCPQCGQRALSLDMEGALERLKQEHRG